MAIKKAKARMASRESRCDMPCVDEEKMHISISEVVNGFIIRLNGEEIIVETDEEKKAGKKKVLEVVDEILK